MTRKFPWLAIALIALGCTATPAEPEKTVSAAGKNQKIVTPPKLTGGSIRGRVVDLSGAPIGGVEVRVPGAKSLTANPLAQDVHGEIDNGRTMTLMHDFKDGKGEVLAERRPRLTQTQKEEYVYLHPGEFFLDAVPAGRVSVTGSLLSAVASPVTITVTNDKTTSEVTLILPLGGTASPSPSPSPATGG